MLEGTHGLFHGFARSIEGDYGVLTSGFGEKWFMDAITFKPYATGHHEPAVRRLRAAAARKRGVRAEDVKEILCETAEGYVHRLWEPLASKHRPANAYAAKFSTPFNIAVAFVTGGAGLAAFTETTVKDERILALASKVRYVVDPKNPYPRAYTGHILMTLKDGKVVEERQPHIRGGAHEPLTRAEIETSSAATATWRLDGARIAAILALAVFFDGKLDLTPFRG